MKLPAHYYRQHDADLCRDVPEESFGGWATTTVEINPVRTALVVMHAYDCGTPEEFPGWFRCCPENIAAARVAATVLTPLLAAVRAAGWPVLHVAAGMSYCRGMPGYARAVALAGPEPELAHKAVRDPVSERLQQARRELAFPGAHNQADCDHGWQHTGFLPAAAPIGNEGIAANAHQLAALATTASVNHLIYTGFFLDWCLLMAHGGMVDMARRGFICSVIRDGVVAVENRESAPQRLALAIGLWRVSLEFGFVFDASDFCQALAGKSESRGT